MLRSAHQFLKSPAEKERRDPDQPRPKDAAADRDICKRSAAGVRNARNTWRAIRAQIRPCRCAGSDEVQKAQRVGRDRTAPSLDAPSLHLLPIRLLQGPAQPSASNAFLATRSCENAALRRCYDPSHETHHPCVDSADHLGQLGVDGPVSQNPPQTPIRRGNHRSAIPLA